MAQERIGFVGLGNMGGRITRRLVAAGHRVDGFDLDATRISACDATPVPDLASLARTCSCVFLSLPDSTAIEQVVFADNGLLANARAGQLLVDLSTASAASTRRIAARFAEIGALYLDAGISGGAPAAEKGVLTLMVGGDAAALERVSPLLASFSSKVVHMGASGAGHATKLLNNFLNAVSLSATAEVMVAGRKAGLDLNQLLEVINSSSGVNFASLNRFPHIVAGDYLEGGLTGKLMTKDIVLYIDLLHELGVSSLNAAGPLASFGLGTALGYGDQISNRVVDAIGDASGGVRLQS